MTLGVGAEARQVDDRIFRLECSQLVSLGPHQQSADEEVVPGELVDHPHLDAMLRLRSAIEVGDEQHVLVGQRQQEVVVKPIERRGIHRLVGLAPPDTVLGNRIADNKLILRAAAGVAAGAHDQRSVFRKQTLAAAHGVLDQRRGLEIPKDLGAGRNALLLKPKFCENAVH